MRLKTPRRYLLYCSVGQELHPFKSDKDHMECVIDGRRYLGSNMLIWYSYDETDISLPDELEIA
jgi:hypothetical protein